MHKTSRLRQKWPTSKNHLNTSKSGRPAALSSFERKSADLIQNCILFRLAARGQQICQLVVLKLGRLPLRQKRFLNGIGSHDWPHGRKADLVFKHFLLLTNQGLIRLMSQDKDSTNLRARTKKCLFYLRNWLNKISGSIFMSSNLSVSYNFFKLIFFQNYRTTFECELLTYSESDWTVNYF